MAEAMFTGDGGPVFSWGARITVNGSSANGTTTDLDPTGRLVSGVVTASGSTPVITEQPKGAELTSGKSTTLSVTAGTSDGGTLRYQWYVSASDDNTKGQAIAGATSASYTPGEIQGTRYYYVGVWSEKNGAKSDTVFSETAAVVYSSVTASPAPGSTSGNAPTPASTANANGTTGNTGVTGNNNGTVPAASSPEVAPAPTEQVTAADGTAPTPSPAVAEPIASRSGTGSSLPVVLGAIAAVALAAGVGLVVLRRNSGQ